MATEDILINDGDGFVSLSELAAEQVDVELPINSADGTVILQDGGSIDDGSKIFAVVIDTTTRVRVGQTGKLYVFGEEATTFFNKSEAVACFSKFESARASCFVGTESYSPFVVKDSAGANTLISVNSVGVFAAVSDIRTNSGRFLGQCWTTTDGDADDPAIKLNDGLDQIQLAVGPSDVLIVHPSYVKSAVDIQTVGIAGREAPDTDARIDLGPSFVVSKGDGTERFSINTQSGQIEQTASAYTAFEITSSNATGALIKSSCGGGTYSFGATNLGWLVMDESLNALLIVSETDIKAASSYTPSSPSSLATKQTVDDKIWVGTTAEYNALDPAAINPTTLYCLTD